MNDHLIRSPVECGEFEVGDLAGAQAEAGQQQQDRVIAPADERATSQPRSSLRTTSAVTARGSDAPNHPETDGTAPTSVAGVSRRAYK